MRIKITRQDLKRLSGTFWNGICSDPFFDSLAIAQLCSEEQTNLDYELLTNSSNRRTTPVFRTVQHCPLICDRAAAEGNSWPKPSKLHSVAYITDKLLNPNKIWFPGVDFQIADRVTFTVDPLGEDQEVVLWLHYAEFDENYLQDFWGAPIGLHAPSSTRYRDLLCEVYNTLTTGTSKLAIKRIVAMLYGVPLAEGNEVVEEVEIDQHGFFVATDKMIYRGGSAIPVVTIGMQLTAGDPIFNTVIFYSSLEDIPEEQLPALTLPRRFLDWSIQHDLTFPNRDVPLRFVEGRVEFEISGDAADITRFWNIFNARTTPKCEHIADLLAGQQVINPCKFVQQNVLRSNSLLCILRAKNVVSELAGINHERLLRQLIPPHEALIITSLAKE